MEPAMNDRIREFRHHLARRREVASAHRCYEKLHIARQLEKLGVDVIAAGFAAGCPGDAEAIRAFAEAILVSTVCSLARANERDIHAAGGAIKPARSGRIHTFIATSPIHMEKKLRMQPDQVVEAAVKAVKLA
jgi:2-isopropylmalate synthase